MNASDILNSTPKMLKSEWHLNPDTGYMLRQIYGETERFVYHTHDYYEIFLTISGTIIHYVNGSTQVLEPGCLVFIRPNDRHLYIYQNEKNYAFTNLAVSCEIVEGMFEFLKPVINPDLYLNCEFPPEIRLSKNKMQSLIKKFDEFNSFPSEDQNLKRLNIRKFLLDVFIKYFLEYPPDKTQEIPLWLEYTCEKMKKQQNFYQGISKMVEISGKTQEHLARSVKKYYGKTLSEFINELRLNYAANLITNSNLKITDICYEAGFGNISSFYTLFKKMYGVSPKKLRD